MDFLQIDGKEIPLLEAPQRYEDPPRRILYVLFKHKRHDLRDFSFADCADVFLFVVSDHGIYGNGQSAD